MFRILCQTYLVLSILCKSLVAFQVLEDSRLHNSFRVRAWQASVREVSTISDFHSAIREGIALHKLDVQGNLDQINDLNDHPVVQLLYDRKKRGNNSDGFKLGLAIEGGGMRGCVAAGMVTALWYLGLDDCVDVVYGSSAGSLVGAYFITKQLPYGGPEIYYKLLTSAGKRFIDTKYILRSCGLGLLDLRLSNILNLATDRLGSPVLNLDFLLNDVVKIHSPLDWEMFWQRQKVQPLKIIASGLFSKGSVVLSAVDKNFNNIDELTSCLRASMLLPGVAGAPVQLKGDQILGANLRKANWTDYIGREKIETFGSEPLLDAQLFEPIPYRSALNENCSHVLVFRTRADGIKVTKRISVVEKMMLKRYFRKKLKLPDVCDWMLKQEIYSEDILRLNEESRNFNASDRLPKICCIALPRGVKEVSRLEMSKQVILENIREGFAVVFDRLVTDHALKGKGKDIANKIWSNNLIEK